MSKMVECAKVDSASGCGFVARGGSEEEVFQQVAVHAKEHGIREVTPELIEKVRANIREA